MLFKKLKFLMNYPKPSYACITLNNFFYNILINIFYVVWYIFIIQSN